MQNVLTYSNDLVYIQAENGVYSDTMANFLSDGGSSIREGTNYNQSLKVYLIDGKLQKTSTVELDTLIKNVGNFIAKKSARELTVIEEETNTVDNVKASKLSFLQGLLDSTDYLTNKYVEGALSEEEFANAKEKRANWRKLYNDIEACTTLEQLSAYNLEVE